MKLRIRSWWRGLRWRLVEWIKPHQHDDIITGASREVTRAELRAGIEKLIRERRDGA